MMIPHARGQSRCGNGGGTMEFLIQYNIGGAFKYRNNIYFMRLNVIVVFSGGGRKVFGLLKSVLILIKLNVNSWMANVSASGFFFFLILIN